MTRFSWARRIERADELARIHAFASEVLRFYREIACFQKSLSDHLESAGGIGISKKAETSLRLRFDATLLLHRFPPLLTLVQRVAPPPLAQAAATLAQEEPARWRDLLTSYWRSGLPATGRDETDGFFARAFLQPYAEYLASRTDLSSPRYGEAFCPFCDRKPQVGILREEAQGAKRSFLCSLCSTEWDYRRIICPACGENRFDRLPVYTAAQFEHVRVEACDTCQIYLKTVNLTKDALAVPVVDELATTPLDLWAHERGYKKLELNLLRL